MYLMVYYDGYGYNFYYGDYGYYEYSVNTPESANGGSLVGYYFLTYCVLAGVTYFIYVTARINNHPDDRCWLNCCLVVCYIPWCCNCVLWRKRKEIRECLGKMCRKRQQNEPELPRVVE